MLSTDNPLLALLTLHSWSFALAQINFGQRFSLRMCDTDAVVTGIWRHQKHLYDF